MKKIFLILFFALGIGVLVWLYKKKQAQITAANPISNVAPTANSFWTGWKNLVTGQQTNSLSNLVGNIRQVSNILPTTSGSGSGAPSQSSVNSAANSPGTADSDDTAATDDDLNDYGGDGSDYGDDGDDYGDDDSGD